MVASKKMRRMDGTAVTYLGVVIAVVGLGLAVKGNARGAVVCLILAGVCDVLDGPVARRHKRTRAERLYGVQADSLADVLAFCALPIAIFCALGFTAWYQLGAYAMLAVAGVARLSLFNLRAGSAEGRRLKSYTGLPVTSAALVFPALYLLFGRINYDAYNFLVTCVVMTMAVLFVAPFRLKKPGGWWYGLLAAAAMALAVLAARA